MASSIKIEVGKSYMTRDGEQITIQADTGQPGRYRFQGEDAEGRLTWRSAKGRFGRHPHRLDLVAAA
jgi:hypothetical protein